MMTRLGQCNTRAGYIAAWIWCEMNSSLPQEEHGGEGSGGGDGYETRRSGRSSTSGSKLWRWTLVISA